MKSAKSLKSLFLVLCLSIGVLSAACIKDIPPCRFCGFNAGEQVQDVGTGGGIYAADGNGCVTINGGESGCSRFDIQPLIGES